MAYIQFGNTWWGSKFLDSLKNIDFSNRLPRGKSYARNGKVEGFKLDQNIVTGKVAGNRKPYYHIKLIFPEFSEKEKKKILDIVIGNNFYISKLLNRQIPTKLFDELAKNNIRLFPTSWDDLDGNCSCPDWAEPCKHMASIIYLIANEIDKNPFIVFQLHSFDIVQELEKNNYIISQKDTDILDIQSFHTRGQVQNISMGEIQDMLDSIDFSIIPAMKENILTILSPKPLFYLKNDFKEILSKYYYRLSKSYNLKENPVDNELLFQIDEQITINLNKKMEFDGDINLLIKQLNSIKIGDLFSHSRNVILIYMVYQFAKILSLNSAIVPQLLKLSDNKFKIRWLPALMDENIRKIYNQLLSITSENLLSLDRKMISGKEQLSNMIAIFLNYFVKEISSNSLVATDDINDLFFRGAIYSSQKLDEKNIATTINIWLKRFFISEKRYSPLIKIEEKKSNIALSMFFQDKKSDLGKLISMKQAFRLKEKIEILKDLAIITDYFTELEEIVSNPDIKTLSINYNELDTILFDKIPVLRLLGLNVLLPKSLEKIFRPKLSLSVQSNSKTQSVVSYLSLLDLVDFDWKIAIGDEFFTASQFQKLIRKTTGMIKLKNKFVYLNPSELEKIKKQMEKDPRVNKNTILHLLLSEEYQGNPLEISSDIKKLILKLKSTKDIELPLGLNATLRGYQKIGYDWLYRNSQLGFGSLIADDMGLGKTIQVIALLLKFKQDNIFQKTPGLIVVPTALITNWQQEISKFTDDLNYYSYHGSQRVWEIKGYDIIITTYGILRQDIDKFTKKKWSVFVIDESQNIKNISSLQTKATKKIKSNIKIAMSGTPVENRLSEYWSVFDFTNKGYLGNFNSFKTNFAKPIEIEKNHEKIDLFRKITEPFILRRLKSDKSIIKDLPEKIEIDTYCHLSKKQASIYENIIEKGLSNIGDSDGIEKKGLVLKMITELKQVCNHPYQFLKKGKKSIELSGKVETIINLLETINDNNEKVLIFTQYKEMGNILKEILEERFQKEILFYHGGVTRKKRDEMIEDFQNKIYHKIMIVSLKAGGVGLNLTAANNVIHFDLWWNPAVESQATDRVYRIGQKKNVMVYRFITKGTFEEKINNMLLDKKDLANLTVNVGEKWIGDFDENELKNLVALNGEGSEKK